MKNITEYNEFVKLSKSNKLNELNETPKGDTGGYGGGGDTYFANVKGNLAGAENTLVGSAVLKLFGFIKRKGLQMYMKKVLKPKLGRVYMNGVLRYATQNGIGNFARKQFFEIEKIEDKKRVAVEEQVKFEKEGVNGLSAFEKGAEVKKKSGELLEDGQYIVVMNDAQFTIKGGKIEKLTPGVDSTSTDESTKEESKPDEKIIAQIDDDELEQYRKKLEEELKKQEEEGVKADQDIIDECASIIKSISDNKGSLDDDDVKSIQLQVNKIDKNIDQMRNMGLNEIEKLLKKEDLKNRTEIRKDKLIYEANILQLLKLRKFLLDVINNKETKKVEPEITSKSSTETIKEPVVISAKEPVTVGESHIYEAELAVDVKDKKLRDKEVLPTKVKTTKIGDELQEIAKSGDAVDLNNEEFYKQFEDEKHRKGVTDTILRDKADIAKIQLAADRIISGNAKQENAWKKMVENVKSMYSKFMVTDLVDPYNVMKSSSDADIEKWTKQNGKTGGEAAKLETVKQGADASKNKNFVRATEKIIKLSKLGRSDTSIMKLEFYKGPNDSTDYYIVENTTSGIKGLNLYRLLGTISFDKISEHTETDFKSLVKKSYPSLISPIIDDSGMDKEGKGIRAVYVVYGSEKHLSTGTSNNIVTMMYLFANKKEIDFDKSESYVFKIKNFETKTDYDLPSTSAINPSKPYKVNLRVDESSLTRIVNNESFVEYTKYDISNESAVKKMEGLNSLFS